MTPSSYLFTENTFVDVKTTLARSETGSTSDKIRFLPLNGLTVFCQDTHSKFKYFFQNRFIFHLISNLFYFLFLCL